MPSDHGPLRVGLLLDSWTVPAWVARVVDDVVKSDFAEVALVVMNGTPPRPRSVKRVAARRGQLLWRAYMAADARLFRVGRNPFVRRNLEAALEGVPVIRATPEMRRFSDALSEADVRAIREHDLDVVLRFGFRILRGEILEVARHGVWSFHHGDNEVNRGGPPGFWEVVEGEPVTGSVLQVLTSDLDDGKVLYRSWSSTHRYSVLANRARLYNKTAAFAVRKLRELHETGVVTPARENGAPGYRPYSAPLYRTPSNREMVPILLRLAGRMAVAGLRNLAYRGSWFVAYRVGEPGRLPGRFYDFKLLQPPGGRSWADPFPITHEGRHYIFLEEWSARDARAWISVVEIGERGAAGPAVPVLKRPYHLSYPFVFRWNGGFYMIPETKENRTVELYRCEEFPHRWTLERVLLENVDAVDATVEEVDGTWWMWLNTAEPGASILDELHLYSADSPLGPWRPHPRNPVKSDVRSARPAGRLFRMGADLVRPAQDGSERYGYAVTFNRVVRLTHEEYVEEPISKLLPHWRKGLLGTHTFNHDGGLTVVDGFRYRGRLAR